ncbi:transcription factor A, mitochondrial-like isoform X2 [Rhodnius prolixus]|uniref:Putative mitochondrial transcription factor a n=2 Tax=Rhodnius TaxID=13248 RepID=A0A0P4VQL8_9HEMI
MTLLQSAVLKFSSYCRCVATARFTTSTYCNKQSLEEKLGLNPKPRKPVTPFFRFIASIRPEILQQQPNMKPTEIVKVAAERWKKADENTKDNLKKLYDQDVLKYLSELKQYEQNLSPGDRDMITLEKESLKLRKERGKLKKRREELGRPRKPTPPFLLFLQSQVSKRGTTSYKEWIASITNAWKSLSQEDKAPYFEKHKKEMEEFKTKLEKWEKEMVTQGLGSVIRQH